MPLLPLDRGPITELRQALAASQQRLDAVRVDAAVARSQLAAAEAGGEAAHRIESLQAAVTQAETQLKAAARTRAGLVGGIREQSDQLLRERDPAELVQALEGDVPIALLPVRLETRYLDEGRRLAIRIYPDTVHVMRHLRGLTEAERRGGHDYWAAATAEPGTEATVWRRLVASYRAPRAEFIVRATDPANADEAEAVTTLSRQTVALLLPDRFCAVGYAAGRREVFREWGRPVPDILPMSPELDPTLASAGEAKTALFGPEREWMFRFEAALEVGMAIQITDAHVRKRLNQRHDPVAFAFGSPLERLVVLGVDWTLGSQAAALALEDLLAGHAASHGLGVVPLGTPTNNTARSTSPRDSGEVPPPPAVDAAPTPAVGATDAYDLLLRALGLPGQTLLPEMLPGAALAEQRTQMHMVNALWRGTFGRYLDELWNVSIVDTEYVTDAAIDMTRRFVVGWVRPGGPLPTLRIGKQPYGVLPVVAGHQPSGADETGIAKVLAFLRPAWRDALGSVPRIDGKSLDGVRELIQSGPWSVDAKFRNIENPNKSVKVTGLTGQYGQTQTASKKPVVAHLLGAFGIAQKVEVLVEHLTHDVQAHDLGHVPWVQADPADRKKPRAASDLLDPPFIAQIADALGDSAHAKSRLTQRSQQGSSLLEALLAFSAEEEFDRVGLRTVDSAIAASPHAAARKSLALSKATPAFVGIAPASAPSAFLEVASSRAMNDLKIPNVTGGQTIEAHVAGLAAAAPAPEHRVAGTAVSKTFDDFRVSLPSSWRDLGSVKASLRQLAPLTVGELDTAFRLTLDTFSYRLDAWFTGLATKRLEAVRQSRDRSGTAQGLHLGAYGFVEDLHRDTAPDSLGYTHAPSLTQAAAAAMLRSGFLANVERGGEAFNIDLSSARVQQARSLIEGIERGQAPAALLGYRFERALRETPDFVGAQYILDFRLRFPLRPAGTTPGEQPAEKIAARDVVDGLALLDAWRTGSKASLLALVAAPHRVIVAGVVDALAATWDAVSDVMVSESVYQLAQNNLDRAAAAAAMLDANGAPLSPQVTQTPRAGVSYAQRLMLLCAARPLADAWTAAAANDPRSAAEPRLDAWLARMLGAPDRFAFKALKMRGDAIDGEPIVVDPAELGRGPLSLVLGAAVQPGDDGSRGAPLRRWLVEAFAQRLPADAAGLRLDILERNGPGEALGLAEFEALAVLLRTLVAGVRPLNRHDLVVPKDEIELAEPDLGEHAGVDRGEVEGRATAALRRLAEARQRLVDAAGDHGAIDGALRAAWPFALREADPAPLAADATEAQRARWAEDHLALRDRVVREIEERQAASLGLEPRHRRPAEDRDPTPPEAIGIAIERLKLVFGKDFPVLPVFTLGPYAAAVAASLADRGALTGADPFAVAGWLPKLARVREGADRLDAALTAREALLEESLADDLALWQLPHVAGRAWAARPEAWAGKDLRKVVPQLAVVAAGADALAGLGADTALAGLSVDEWQEVIPDAVQTTGVSFHYDAPGARPPQAILLAVPPRLGMTEWRFDEVLATVHEAFDLAQLRTVRPKDLGAGLGNFLPANFLPQSFGAEVPGVGLWRMAHDHASLAARTVALGKI